MPIGFMPARRARNRSGFGLTNFSSSLDQFSRSQPFDLNSVTFQNFESEAPGGGSGAACTIVIFGYLDNTLMTPSWFAAIPRATFKPRRRPTSLNFSVNQRGRRPKSQAPRYIKGVSMS